MKRLLSSIAVILFAAVPAVAANWWDEVRLGVPSYNGTGCPIGSAAVALAPDASSLSILFDKYVADAGGNTGRQRTLKTCNIAIPVHVPQGYSVSIFNIDYRGFNSLPYGAYSRFQVEYFFAGSQGPTFLKTFSGFTVGSYNLRNTLAANAIVWSPCGAQVLLRANSSMLTSTNASMAEAFSSVDSVDLDSGLIYHLKWRTCN